MVTNVATPSRPPTGQTARRGKVELIKENSDYLRHPLMQAGCCCSRFCCFSAPLLQPAFAG